MRKKAKKVDESSKILCETEEKMKVEIESVEEIEQSYYYDDAHGYEVYDDDDDDEEFGD